MGLSTSNTIVVDPVTINELCTLILSLKSNKSSGHDGFGPLLVKDNVNFIM